MTNDKPRRKRRGLTDYVKGLEDCDSSPSIASPDKQRNDFTPGSPAFSDRWGGLHSARVLLLPAKMVRVMGLRPIEGGADVRE